VITDISGRAIGRHGGIHRFTIGQRKGLGLASREPLYVVALDPETNRVVVGPRAALERTALVAREVNWIACDAPSDPLRVEAQIRYRHQPAPARVVALEHGRARVDFDVPQPAITPGQAVVFYDGDVVVGGGWIERAIGDGSR
jgi:tRNA-specific 2-thiouridylase